MLLECVHTFIRMHENVVHNIDSAMNRPTNRSRQCVSEVESDIEKTEDR